MAIRYSAQFFSLISGLAVSTAMAAPRVETFGVEGGRSIRVLYDAPTHPVATLIMLPGGTGHIGIEPNGHIRHAHDFSVRTRNEWVARGYAVVIPDAPDRVSLRGYRHTAEYAQVLKALITHVRLQSTSPYYLISTSQGTIAAVNAAAQQLPIDGIVLAETVSVKGRSGETVFDAIPEAVRIPVLIVANAMDQCWVAPPSNAERVAASMSASQDVQILNVSGGSKVSSRNCGALSPHGYYGIEDNVIDGIQRWLEKR